MVNNKNMIDLLKNHATNIKITSITRHKKCFSTSNTKVKARSDQGSMALTWMKP